MKLFPSISQYGRWSLPSKLTFWGFWISVISLTFAIFHAPILSTLSDAIKDSRVRFVLTGVWEAELSKNGAVYIPVEDGQSLQFNVSSNNGANVCFIEGEANWSRNAFTHLDSFTGCRIDILPNKAADKLEVSRSEECLSMCGLGADFGGTYSRKPLSLSFDGGLSSIEDARLQAFLGETYDEIADILKKQTIVERDGGYTVISGYERGLFPYISAVAVIDAQSISVGFSLNSDPQMLFSDYRHRNNALHPLKDWLENFKELDLFSDAISEPESFVPPAWCPNAATNVEALICDDKELSLLDAELNASYRVAVARVDSETSSALRATQRAWLGQRKNCEANKECIAKAYRSRIFELSAYR